MKIFLENYFFISFHIKINKLLLKFLKHLIFQSHKFNINISYNHIN